MADAVERLRDERVACARIADVHGHRLACPARGANRGGGLLGGPGVLPAIVQIGSEVGDHVACPFPGRACRRPPGQRLAHHPCRWRSSRPAAPRAQSHPASAVAPSPRKVEARQPSPRGVPLPGSDRQGGRGRARRRPTRATAVRGLRRSTSSPTGRVADSRAGAARDPIRRPRHRWRRGRGDRRRPRGWPRGRQSSARTRPGPPARRTSRLRRSSAAGASQERSSDRRRSASRGVRPAGRGRTSGRCEPRHSCRPTRAPSGSGRCRGGRAARPGRGDRARAGSPRGRRDRGRRARSARSRAPPSPPPGRAP